MGETPLVRFTAVARGVLGQPEVPAGTMAIALAREGLPGDDLLPAGVALPPGAFLLVPADAVTLTFDFGVLRGADEQPFTCVVEVAVTFGRSVLDGRLFRSEILGTQEELTAVTLRRALVRYTRPAVAAFFREKTIDTVAAETPETRSGVAAILAEYLGRCGLEGPAVRAIRVGGDALERFRREREDIEAERRRNEETARARLEVGRQVRERELEQEVRTRDARLAQKLSELERLDATLGTTGLEAQIFQLGDDRLKARLYELLLERELTPEQLRARAEGRTPEDVAQEIETLRAQVRSLHARQRRTTLGVACDERLFLWDVRADSPPLARAPIAAGFGPVRSLVGLACDGVRAVACGTTRGVVVVSAEDGTVMRRFALPEAGRHGVNAMACGPNDEGVVKVWATHREAGIHRWPLDGGAGEQVSPRPARGVAFDASGRAVCGVDGGVLVAGAGGEELRPLSGEVTCVSRVGDAVLIGTAQGVTYRLPRESSDLEVVGSAPGPVVSLCAAERSDAILYAVSRREQRVECRDLGGTVRHTFVAPRPVGWVAAAGGLVAGALGGGRVCLWFWDRPAAPAAEVSVPGDVRAVFVWEDA